MPPLPLPRYQKVPREFFIRKAKPAGREGGGGRERTNYGPDTEVWISQNSTIPDSNIIALEALLQTKSEKKSSGYAI